MVDQQSWRNLSPRVCPLGEQYEYGTLNEPRPIKLMMMAFFCTFLLILWSFYAVESTLYAVHINETTQRVAVRQILYDNGAKGELSQWSLYLGQNEPFFRYFGYSTMDKKRETFISECLNTHLFVWYSHSRPVQKIWILFFCQHHQQLCVPDPSTLPIWHVSLPVSLCGQWRRDSACCWCIHQ